MLIYLINCPFHTQTCNLYVFPFPSIEKIELVAISPHKNSCLSTLECPNELITCSSTRIEIDKEFEQGNSWNCNISVGLNEKCHE